jgi:hypothetical protein
LLAFPPAPGDGRGARFWNSAQPLHRERLLKKKRRGSLMRRIGIAALSALLILAVPATAQPPRGAIT